MFIKVVVQKGKSRANNQAYQELIISTLTPIIGIVR